MKFRHRHNLLVAQDSAHPLLRPTSPPSISFPQFHFFLFRVFCVFRGSPSSRCPSGSVKPSQTIPRSPPTVSPSLNSLFPVFCVFRVFRGFLPPSNHEIHQPHERTERITKHFPDPPKFYPQACTPSLFRYPKALPRIPPSSLFRVFRVFRGSPPSRCPSGSVKPSQTIPPVSTLLPPPTIPFSRISCLSWLPFPLPTTKYTNHTTNRTHPPSIPPILQNLPTGLYLITFSIPKALPRIPPSSLFRVFCVFRGSPSSRCPSDSVKPSQTIPPVSILLPPPIPFSCISCLSWFPPPFPWFRLDLSPHPCPKCDPCQGQSTNIRIA